ncbi:MAG: hypothetical protein JW768_02275 [Chitinispirillaceae bacterium]|nr:hypothetical protein [Chitinispirillaceae bacterium]
MNDEEGFESKTAIYSGENGVFGLIFFNKLIIGRILIHKIRITAIASVGGGHPLASKSSPPIGEASFSSLPPQCLSAEAAAPKGLIRMKGFILRTAGRRTAVRRYQETPRPSGSVNGEAGFYTRVGRDGCYSYVLVFAPGAPEGNSRTAVRLLVLGAQATSGRDRLARASAARARRRTGPASRLDAGRRPEFFYFQFFFLLISLEPCSLFTTLIE